MKFTNICIIAVTLLLLSTLTAGLHETKAQPVTWIVSINGSSDFRDISSAIAAAAPGDIIKVKAGGYLDSLTIDKSITLIGENPLTTFIQGLPPTGAINITANSVNVTGFSISNLPTVNSPAITLFRCSNATIKNNIITDSQIGIALYSSSNCVIDNNTLKKNGCGLSLDASTHNNVFHQNSIIKNTFAIYLYNSYQNTFYHNSILQNTLDVFITGALQNNWDYNYPDGGNYWGDLSGVDQKTGPNQDITGYKDGIADNPYTLSTNNIDKYPLMHPYKNVAGDLNKDGIINFDDIVYFVSGYLSYYKIYSVAPEYRVCDLDNDGHIDSADLITFAEYYVNFHENIHY